MEQNTCSVAIENAAYSLPQEVSTSGIECLPAALADYVINVGYLIDTLPEPEFLKEISDKAAKLVVTKNLLNEEQMVGSDETYKRHQLYVDPLGRFTVLALVWKPGQHTCIHGHNAWGVVGVRQGEIKVDCFETMPVGSERPSAIIQNKSIVAGVGAINAVSTAPSGIHRLGNASDAVAITIHTYGMDLSEQPARINVVYAD